MPRRFAVDEAATSHVAAGCHSQGEGARLASHTIRIPKGRAETLWHIWVVEKRCVITRGFARTALGYKRWVYFIRAGLQRPYVDPRVWGG